MPSETAGTTPTQRDRHIEAVAERGRLGWQKASGYNGRALIEADIGRYKRVIGDTLRSHTDQRQATEAAWYRRTASFLLRPILSRQTR